MHFASKIARAQGDVKMGALWPHKISRLLSQTNGKNRALASKWAIKAASLYLVKQLI